MNDSRYQQLCCWLPQQIALINEIKPLAGDASFRRYFRVLTSETTFIAMDAPPDKENCESFIAIAHILAEAGLAVPKIIARDLAQGFLLLTDLGDDLYFHKLNAANAEQLYRNAIEKLLVIQSCQQTEAWRYVSFQPLLIEELARFREWYLLKHLNLTLTHHEESLLVNSFELLAHTAQQQPQVCVHRDYHSRNLLVLPNNEVGILDFQDAVWGPITYDLISLIRDCYIAWPAHEVNNWALYYHDIAKQEKLFSGSQDEFLYRLDWMGIQRHLKAMYIFARKFRRDNSTAYLGDIPRTLSYVLAACENYPKLQPLNGFLRARVLPYENK